MEFQYHGANCISITTKKAKLVIDDNLAELGLKSIVSNDVIALYTNLPKNAPEAKLVITDPGEYEVSEISVFGIEARGHMDGEHEQTATIYKIQEGDTRVAVLGHIHPDIAEERLEELGAVDILIIPVGGNGYTLDGAGALSVIRKIEPKIIIPTHYEDSGVKYEVPQQPLSEALKVLSMEPREEALARFKPKPADFSEGTQLLILERQ